MNCDEVIYSYSQLDINELIFNGNHLDQMIMREILFSYGLLFTYIIYLKYLYQCALIVHLSSYLESSVTGYWLLAGKQ